MAPKTSSSSKIVPNHPQSPTTSELLRAAASALTSRELCQGHMGLGFAKPPKDVKAEPGTVYPWDVAKLHSVTSVSLLGAICLAAGAPPDDVHVQAAHERVCVVLIADGVLYSPETWCDIEGRTKAEVVDLLRRSARG